MPFLSLTRSLSLLILLILSYSYIRHCLHTVLLAAVPFLFLYRTRSFFSQVFVTRYQQCNSFTQIKIGAHVQNYFHWIVCVCSCFSFSSPNRSLLPSIPCRSFYCSTRMFHWHSFSENRISKILNKTTKLFKNKQNIYWIKSVITKQQEQKKRYWTVDLSYNVQWTDALIHATYYRFIHIYKIVFFQFIANVLRDAHIYSICYTHVRIAYQIRLHFK